jgi:predicted PurR-regulated permease PerM
LTVLEICLVVICVLLTLAFMRWAEAFLVPLLVGVLLSYTFDPAVAALERWRIQRVVGALFVLGSFSVGCVSLVYVLSDDAAALTDLVPQAASKVRSIVQSERGKQSQKPLANLQKAATELEKAAAEATGAPAPAKQALPPAKTAAPGAVQEWLVTQLSHVATVLVQLGTALLIAFFLLAAGDAFRRKLARVAGPTLARRRIAITMLNDIDTRIQRYMATVALTNALIALGTWAALATLGLQHALFWGVMAGLLHIIPYVGTAIAATAVGLVALVQFGDPWEIAAAVGSVLVIASIIGVIFATWAQSRACNVNNVVIIAGLLFFGWLWGGWGLILAVPILTSLKTIADGIVEWRPLAEFLAE